MTATPARLVIGNYDDQIRFALLLGEYIPGQDTPVWSVDTIAEAADLVELRDHYHNAMPFEYLDLWADAEAEYHANTQTH